MPDLLARPLFTEFRETSFVLERDGTLIGFLLGLRSQTNVGHAYIHAVAVAPNERRHGLATCLYRQFFSVVAGRGCHTVRAITSPENSTSIAFHRRLGFAIGELSDGRLHLEVQIDGRPPEGGSDARLEVSGRNSPPGRPSTERTRVRRHPERAAYAPDHVAAILDEALFCHVGFVDEGQPFVIPTIHARLGDVLYLHGSSASRMLRTLDSGGPVCVTATLLDGLVLARSVFSHSMNYRSVVVLGRARQVLGREEKLRALQAIVEHVVPGRWREARRPNDRELKATSVVALPLDEASAKVRSGPPKDAEEDLTLPIWAGVLPLHLTPGVPEPDPSVVPGPSPPPYLMDDSRWPNRGVM